MCSRRGLSLCGVGVAEIWMCNLEFKHFKTFNCYDGIVGEKCLKYVLDLRNFAAEKLSDAGTLVPKHVGVGT